MFIPVETGPLSIYNLGGIIFLQGLMLTPLIFFAVAATMQAMNPDLEEAASVSGAGPLQVLRRVTTPLMMPAVLAAVIYNFMTAIAIFEIPALIGGPGRVVTLATLMYSSIQANAGLPRYGMAGVYGVLLLIPTLVALYLYQRMLQQGDRYAVVTGKGYRPRIIPLGRWKPGSPGGAARLLHAVAIPAVHRPGVGVAAALHPGAVGGRAGLGEPERLRDGAAGARRARARQHGGAGGGGGAAGRHAQPDHVLGGRAHEVPGPPAAGHGGDAAARHAEHRHRLRGGVYRAGAGERLPLYGTVAAIVLAHTVAFVSFGTRTANSALLQVHRELEEAAFTSGASAVVALRRIILPLVLPAVLYTMLWVGLLSLREVSMALFLQRPQNTVLATQIWNYWMSTKPAEAAALGTMLIVVVADRVHRAAAGGGPPGVPAVSDRRHRAERWAGVQGDRRGRSKEPVA